MKRTVFILLALCLASAGALRAQTTKVAVKKGAKLAYTVDTKIEVVRNVSGEDVPITTLANGALDVAVRSVSARKIDWSFGVPKLQLTVKSTFFPGGSRDTVVKGRMLNFSTDPAGNVTNAEKIATDPAMSTIGGGLQRNAADQLFSPLLGRPLKVGDVWEESHVDTVDNPAFKGARTTVSQTLRYTYDGEVDTLNTRTHRVRSAVKSLSLTGDMSYNGMSVKIDGDGTGIGNYYYSVADGMLVNSGLNSTINMRMSARGQMAMIVPVLYKASTTVARKGK
jgi:hypothetical protein